MKKILGFISISSFFFIFLIFAPKSFAVNTCQTSVSPTSGDLITSFAVSATNLQVNNNTQPANITLYDRRSTKTTSFQTSLQGNDNNNRSFTFSLPLFQKAGNFYVEVNTSNGRGGQLSFCKSNDFSIIDLNASSTPAPICANLNKSCAAGNDSQCNTSLGCENFICYGGAVNRSAGTCIPRSDFCSRGNTNCSSDNDCRPANETGCSNYYCWITPGRSAFCRFGPQPTPTPTPTPPPLPLNCVEGTYKDTSGKKIVTTDKKLMQECTKIDTALGTFGIEPAGFIRSIFGILLSLSGGIALLLIIISGYRLMTSQGNPEKVQAAREQLTSAVVGLLFIIFSIAILTIIGVDILRLPGFRP